jgi:hypothetical protein
MVALIAIGFEIAEQELPLQPLGDRGDASPDLSRDEGLAANRALMVEQNSVRRCHRSRDSSP